MCRRLHAAVPLLCAILIASAGIARAQVATPNLTPIDGATTGNPATLPFAPTSFIGATAAEGDARTIDNTGAEIAAGDASNQQVGLRLVGETFALGVQAINDELALRQTASTRFDFTQDSEAVVVNLGIRLGENLAIGLGQEQGEGEGTAATTITFPPAVDFDAVEKRSAEIPVIGVVYRLTETMYLGAAYGRESLEIEQVFIIPAPVNITCAHNFSAERDLWRAGLGVLWVGSGGAFRIEAAAEHRDAYTEPDCTGSNPDKAKNEVDASNFEVEARWGSLALGLRTRDREELDDGATVTEQEEQAVSIGWQPEQGLAITVAVLSGEIAFSSPLNAKHEFDSTVLNVAWQF